MANVILIGPPGSGKSHVGKELAQLLGLPFHDSDAEIVKRAGKSIADIFVDEGEPHFRALEAQVVSDLLSEEGILSLGGGAVMNETTQSLLRDAITQGAAIPFLHINLTTAVSRVGLNKDRPMLLINPRQQWTQLMEQRRPIYESLATSSHSTDDREASEVAKEIAESIPERKVGK